MIPEGQLTQDDNRPRNKTCEQNSETSAALHVCSDFVFAHELQCMGTFA